MINTDWPRLIQSSCINHFDTQKGDYNFWVEGTLVNRQNWTLWCSFFLMGPRFTEISRNNFHIDCDIQLTLTEIPDNISLYRLSDMVGYFASLMTTIPIYDGLDIIGCLNRQNAIDVMNYGSPSPGTNLLQSTVSASYRMTLEGET